MTREQIKAEFKAKLKQYGYSHHAKPIIDFAEHIAKLEREECISAGNEVRDEYMRQNRLASEEALLIAAIDDFQNAIRARSGE